MKGGRQSCKGMAFSTADVVCVLPATIFVWCGVMLRYCKCFGTIVLHLCYFSIKNCYKVSSEIGFYYNSTNFAMLQLYIFLATIVLICCYFSTKVLLLGLRRDLRWVSG
jgi:hypothetical protein